MSAFACGAPIPISRGERIAQLVPVHQTDIKIKFVDEFVNQTLHGSGGFGSTGIEYLININCKRHLGGY